jgi:hypothetical protein
MKKAKVQIVETSNKNIKVGDKFKVNISGEKSRGTKGVGGGKGSKKPKQPSFKEVVLQFIEQQKTFNNEVVSFIKEQRQVNEEQKEFNKRIETKVDNLENKVDNVIELNNLKS